MVTRFLKDEVNWRIIQTVLTLVGVVAACFFAFQQNHINQQLLDINFALNTRVLLDFKYDYKSGTATFTNYGENAIKMIAAGLDTLPKNKISTTLQIPIFPKASAELNLNQQVELMMGDTKDASYGGIYNIYMEEESLRGKKYFVAQLYLGFMLKNSKISYLTSSQTLSITEYLGSPGDFLKPILEPSN